MINEHLSNGKSSVNVTEVGGDGKEAYCTTDGWSFCFAFQTILFHCNIKKNIEFMSLRIVFLTVKTT